MNDMSRRPRSQAVRSAAQAHLAALREERLARRRAARSRPVSDPEPMPDTDPIPDVDEAELTLAEAQPIEETVDDIAAFVPADAPDESPDDVEFGEAEELSAIDEEPETADAPVQTAAQEAPAPEEPAPTQDAAEEVDTDLDQLPGIGPGLIWMLQSAGIASLSDMASADPEALGAKLGLVGQLLDLDFWIAEAADLQPGTA